MTTNEMLPVGTRVRFTKLYDTSIPGGVVDAGATGTVAIADPDLYAVTLDETIEALADWDNEAHAYPLDDPEGGLLPIEAI